MRGKSPSEDDVRHLKELWTAHRSESRAKVHRIFEHRYGKDIIGLRKAQQLIPTFSQSTSGEPIPLFKYVEWERWGSKQKNPETSAFLLTMDAVSMAVQRRHLYKHEAAWGMRLRGTLQGLMPYDQLCFVTLYAIRDVQAHYAEGKPFTADLDVILAYKPWPWLPENAHAYAMATRASLAPKPLPGSREELSYEAAVDNFSTGKAWETLRVDLRPPWYIHPDDLKSLPFIADALSSAESLRERTQERKAFTLQEWEYRFKDTALQFWMGDNPLFEKRQLHGIFGLIEPHRPDIESPAESNTHEEVHQ